MLTRKHIGPITFDKIMELEDEEIAEAYLQPQVPRRAKKVFDFLRRNENLVTSASGMGYVVTGLDRHKLVELAKGYTINLFRYMFAVDMYEDGLLRRQQLFREE